jgi:hypothetical protein
MTLSPCFRPGLGRYTAPLKAESARKAGLASGVSASARRGPEDREMNIAEGTFRLSIVIAVLVAAYYGISDYMAAVNSNAEDMRIWTTLRCGERFLGQDMSSYTRCRNGPCTE